LFDQEDHHQGRKSESERDKQLKEDVPIEEFPHKSFITKFYRFVKMIQMNNMRRGAGNRKKILTRINDCVTYDPVVEYSIENGVVFC